MSTLPNPGKNPMLIGGVLLAAFWLYSRSAVAQQQRATIVANRGLLTPGRPTTQPYATPTAVAGQLAAGVVGLLRGIQTGPDKGITVDVGGIATGSTTARDALRAAEVASNPGYYGWTGPVNGAVETRDGSDGSAYPYVDGLPVASVYDPSDYMNNPSVGFWGIE